MGLDGKERPSARVNPEPEPDPLPGPIADEIGRRIAQKTAPRPDPVMLTLRTHTGGEVPYPKPASKATFNETTGEGISWAAWSWNPVTGCLHGCNYCYARAIAHRFTDGFPAGFTPLFHHERLDAPANTTVPAAHRGDPAWKRVFVCSMADLYGRWVPDEWIDQVHASMLASPWWQYILLTKFPARYAGLDLPPNAWVGTSVDEQKRVRIAEDAFRKIGGVKAKWLSLEPLREPLQFDDLSMFDWVVIGAQTETRQPDGTVEAFAPPFEWVAQLVAQAREAGCKVHLKPNLVNGRPGMQLPDEYPEG
jgi:protein gp37